jgi:hypothetical protein
MGAIGHFFGISTHPTGALDDGRTCFAACEPDFVALSLPIMESYADAKMLMRKKPPHPGKEVLFLLSLFFALVQSIY